MKRYIICLILSFFSFTNVVFASKVNKVDIDVFIEDSGDAIVTEKWNIQKQSKNVFQRDFYDAQDIKITDYSISDDKNSSYREVSNKEFNAKDGFVYTFVDNGYTKALKFATIGDKNDYTITYKVEGMIKKFQDVYGIDFYFIGPNDSQTYGAINIKIKSVMGYTETNTGLYTLGNSRLMSEFSNGEINLFCSNQEEKESIRIMTIFTGLEYSNVINVNEKFQDVYNKALRGHNRLEEILSKVKIRTIIILVVILVIVIVFIVVYKIFLKKDDYEEYHNIETAGNGTIVSYDDASYYDSVPLNGDLYKIAFISGYFKLIKSRSDLIGAIVFKWLCEGNIDLGKKHGKSYIHIQDMRQFKRNLDSELYNIWREASNNTGTIDGNKLLRYSSSHYLKVMTWFNMGFSESISDEMARNHITKTKRGHKEITVLGDAIINYGNEIQGLKKYLLNFNQVPRKTSLNEDLYLNLLVCAVLFGIGDQVGREILRKSPDNELAKKLVEFEEYRSIYKGSYEAALTPYKEQIRRLRKQNKKNKNKEFDPSVENIIDNQLHKQDMIQSVDDLPKSKL